MSNTTTTTTDVPAALISLVDRLKQKEVVELSQFKTAVDGLSDDDKHKFKYMLISIGRYCVECATMVTVKDVIDEFRSNSASNMSTELSDRVLAVMAMIDGDKVVDKRYDYAMGEAMRYLLDQAVVTGDEMNWWVNVYNTVDRYSYSLTEAGNIPKYLYTSINKYGVEEVNYDEYRKYTERQREARERTNKLRAELQAQDAVLIDILNTSFVPVGLEWCLSMESLRDISNGGSGFNQQSE